MNRHQPSPDSEMRSAKHARGREGKTLDPGMATEGSSGSADSPSHSSFVDLASLAGHPSEFWLNHFSLRLGALLLAGLIVQGCSLRQPNPAKQSFLLEAVRTGEARPPSNPAVMRVKRIQIAAPFAGRGFVYRTSDLGYEVDFYHEFLTSPGNLIVGQLQAWLGSSGLFRSVLPSGANGEATYGIDGNITALYGDFRDPSAPKAVIAAEFFVSAEGRAATGIVFNRRYRQEIPTVGRTADALAIGWSQALGGIFSALEADLATAQLK